MTGRWRTCGAVAIGAVLALGCGDQTIRRGDDAMARQDFDGAIKEYRSAMSQDTSDVAIRYRLVDAYVKRVNVARSLGPLPLQDLERTVAEVHEIIYPVREAEPDLLLALVNLHLSLARNYDEARMPEMAREEWRTIADLQPSATSQYNIGHASILLGDWEGAVEAYEATLRMDEFYTAAHAGIGNAYIQLGRDAEAVDSYRRALDIEPLDTGTRYNMGIALKRTGQTAEAITEFERVVDEDPTYALAYRGMRDAYEKQGDVQAALEWDKRFRDVAGISSDTPLPETEGAPSSAPSSAPADEAPTTQTEVQAS